MKPLLLYTLSIGSGLLVSCASVPVEKNTTIASVKQTNLQSPPERKQTTVIAQNPNQLEVNSKQTISAEKNKVVTNEQVKDKAQEVVQKIIQDGVQDNSANGSVIYRGSGQFINRRAAATRGSYASAGEKDITLQFNNTKITEVVRTIFGELLQQTYIISPRVQGTITFSTAKPIARDQLIYVLEALLNWNSAALVLREGIHHIVPLDEAVSGNITPGIGALPKQPGYEVQIVPLKYIAPSELTKLLKPFLAKTALVHTDDDRNLLMLAGTPDQLRNYLETVKIFDVNWLKGMSVGIFPLEVTTPDTIINELKVVLGTDGPLKKQIRLVPMERINSIIATTAQPSYLSTIQQWVERLDKQASNSTAPDLYVYDVNNVDASELSTTLSEIFDDKSDSQAAKQQTRNPVSRNVVPGLESVEVSKEGVKAVSQPAENKTTALAITDQSNISFKAIKDNNALLIRATPAQYRTILKAIKRLDVPPLQVLIEANILEVTLTDGLSYGVEWYLKNAAVDFEANNNVSGDGFIRLGAGGLSYSVADNNLGVAISALKTSGQTKVLSSPTLWALNNESASISVGTQIPVNTTSINSSGTGDTIASEVQFRDTGVILTVTPRINPGGLVFLDVSQNISSPVGGADSNGNVSVSQREISTKVAVNSGQTVFLGGLISENKIKSRNGVPVLSSIPIVGHLFSSNSDDTVRTEIVVTITPTVIENRATSDALMEEYRQRFRYIAPVLGDTSLPDPASIPASGSTVSPEADGNITENTSSVPVE